MKIGITSVRTVLCGKKPLKTGAVILPYPGLSLAGLGIKAKKVIKARFDPARGWEDCLRQACTRAFSRVSREEKIALIPLVLQALPKKAIAKIMAQEALKFIKEGPGKLQELVFCLPDKEWKELFEKHALGYMDYMANKLRSPYLTVDAIIEVGRGIVVIGRSNPPYGWALPGGFVDYGESLEDAAVREAKEETGLDIKLLRQFHTYSDPGRDPRFHTVGTVFIAGAKGIPAAGDDAQSVRIVTLREVKDMDFAFDHKHILLDYIAYKSANTVPAGRRQRKR